MLLVRVLDRLTGHSPNSDTRAEKEASLAPCWPASSPRRVLSPPPGQDPPRLPSSLPWMPRSAPPALRILKVTKLSTSDFRMSQYFFTPVE